MTRRWTNFAICGLTVAMLSVNAIAQKKVPVSGAENGLVGIKLYDSGQRVIAMYGSPLEIQPVGFGSTAIGPGGGAGGGRGASGGARPQGGSSGTTGQSTSVDQNGPFGSLDFGDQFLRQKGSMGIDDGQGGRGGGLGGPGGGGGRPGGGGASGGSSEGVVYTRWIYKRGMSKYGFILDKQNRVVQIEAIGMQDSRVKTRKGARFGTSFGSLIKTYGTPDGYEINGDSILVRFLSRSKVAFRLNRLGKDKPHQVTGIVVAGGKA